ncbi:alginate lyase family protein [Pontiellaceae bacterium B12219]|nr:alginate lyase family protein [Pontiellaceae bacterium B12219]
MKTLSIVFALTIPLIALSDLRMEIGSIDFSDWSGISRVRKNEASFKSGDTISYTYPDGEHHFHGFKEYFGHACDWSKHAGVAFEIYLKKEGSAEITLSFAVDERDADLLRPISVAMVQVTGEGWIPVYIPWELFDIYEGQKWGALQAVKTVSLTASSNRNKTLKIRNLNVTKGELISLKAPVQGRSVEGGGTVEYSVEIGNTTDRKQNMQLLFSKYGWESMVASVVPSSLALDPNEVKTCTVTVAVPARLPQGVREKQVLKAVPNGQGSAVQTLEFTTAVAVPFPNIVFTQDKWDEVRAKVEKYDWAKKGAADYEAIAKKWAPSDVATEMGAREAYRGQHLYHEREADAAYSTAVAYQLTGNNEYAEKVVRFFRYFTNEEKGYPATWRANAANFVKEGGFFQDIARAYDMVKPSGLFTEADEVAVEKSFRLYISIALEGNCSGAIGNWDLSEYTGAFYCALAIQDLHLAERILNEPTGIYQQLAQGVMSDGWWHECAVGYNLWCARMFSQVGIALEPWGIDFVNLRLPLGTTKNHSLTPRRMSPGLWGMKFEKWGALEQNDICIKDMWDAPLDFLDYRGVLPAVNDATEARVTGQDYELAYYLYRDPEYVAVIQRGDSRDLLYGVPDLPEVESVKITESAYADNMGIVQLRSQTENRPQREQIQAMLRYGTHGGGHGHLDRASLIHLSRYGRSFYNPEMFWYGYGCYLYKFLVQTSMTKNMVVVDQKMQEAEESFRRMYYTGDMMSATVVETEARWSHPPYGGMEYDGLNMTVAEKVWDEGRSMPIPDDAPAYGELTGFTDDKILQRRMMIMMDDYVVLVDYLKGDSEHTFDNLFQIKGFQGLEGTGVEKIRHEDQMNADPLGAGQFITDCQWYKTDGTSRAKFVMGFGKGYDNDGARMRESEDGPLNMDVFNAWPRGAEVMIGTAAEAFPVEKKTWFTIEADGETLLEDQTGAWILGAKDIELDVAGKKQLVLSVKAENNKKDTLFWGDAKIVLNDGSEVCVADLPVMYENTKKPEAAGTDYYGGPVKIQGAPMPKSVPAMPEDLENQSVVTVDLSGVEAVSFKARFGGDFPLGDEAQRRKTMAIRSVGPEARFLSVLEPYETESVIKSVVANSANELTVELIDGRVQEITIAELDSETGEANVFVRELRNGTIIREEKNF